MNEIECSGISITSWSLEKGAYANEFLNDIKCSGIPNHKLRLKNDVLQCQWKILNNQLDFTRVIVNDLAKNFTMAILIMRMNMVQSDYGLEDNLGWVRIEYFIVLQDAFKCKVIINFRHDIQYNYATYLHVLTGNCQIT